MYVKQTWLLPIFLFLRFLKININLTKFLLESNKDALITLLKSLLIPHHTKKLGLFTLQVL